MIDRRKKLAVILLAVVAVLAVLYFAVLSPMLGSDEESDEPALLPGELLDSSGYIMMFEQIEQSNISSISVHNSYGDWEMYKASDGNFYIRDHESVPYNKNTFASLVVSAGYTATLGRVSDSCTGDALAEYGLTGDCASYVIRTMGGAEYKVYIGDLIPTAGGYYARLDGRDAVYIIASDAKNTLLAPVNVMAHPMVTYPMSSTKYYAVKDFYIMNGEDMKIWVDYDSGEDDTGGYNTKAPEGYNANTGTLSDILSKFTEFSGKGAVELGPELSDVLENADEETRQLIEGVKRIGGEAGEGLSALEYQRACVDQLRLLMRALFGDEKLAGYGLDGELTVLHYTYNDIESYVFFGEEQEDGYRYAYSALWNIIVAFDPDDIAFLDYDVLSYVDPALLNIAIADISELSVRSERISETFRLSVDDSGNLSVVADSLGRPFDENELYNFRSMYRSMLLISLQEHTDSRSTDDLLLSFTVTERSGKETEYSFYRYSARRCYYTVNGEGEFYVLADSVEKVISDCEKVMSGLDVDSWSKS